MSREFTVGVFPDKIHSKIEVKPYDFNPISFGVADMVVGLGLTPKMPTEQNKPLLNIVLERHIINNSNKEFLAQLKIEYNFRLDIEDTFNPSEEDLFELMNETGQKFAVEWAKLLHGTQFQHHGKTKALDKEHWIPELERAIDFWNDSIRHIQVDKNGTPLDTD